MSKDESSNGNPGGLLSKVVKFVRNPTTNWSDLDQEDSGRDSGYSKAALKEMIERKRRNDFVRKREFDMLRKLRRREALGVQNPTARPSFFQISTSSSKPDDRAMTLKKIDEIEEQMSMQWWKTKHGDVAERTSNFPQSEPSSTGDAAAATSPTPLGEDPGQPMTRALAPETRPPMRGDADMRTSFPMTEPAPMALLQQGMKGAQAPTPSPANLDLMASGFFGSEMFNVEVDDDAHDPELEEAAIRFANGDDAGAEAGLLEAIVVGGPRALHQETWLALFDLYRATGQREPFETQAERFTENFGRSAPSWFSIPDMVNRAAPKAAPAPAATNENIHWICPPALTLEGLSALVNVLKQTAPPWNIDWRALSSIQEDAVEPLYRQLSILADQPMQLGFLGANHLDSVLGDATQSGDRTVSQAWWLLRMAVLRILRKPDDFELVALNYCVTYEVSPPAWEPPKCGFAMLGGEGGTDAGAAIVGDAHESQYSTVSQSLLGSEFPSTSADESTFSALTVELSGQILGDATAAIELLNTKFGEAEEMVISCAGLIRVDFSAAGTLLNWVSTRHAHGKRVHFTEAHRLVASFLGVIGISELAQVTSRRD